MVSKIRMTVGILTLLALIYLPVTFAADSAYVNYAALDDGSCPNRSTLESIAVGYSHESENRSAIGYIRQAPSGGNCESDSLTINLEVEQRYEVGFGNLDGLLKIGYDKRSVSALYGTSETRSDGQPAFAAALPAGTAETPTVILGVSYSIGDANLDFGYNPLDIDWLEPDGSISKSGTLHFGANTTLDVGFAELEGRLSYDAGNDSFGDATIALVKDFADSPLSLRVAYDYAFGLTALDAGVPITYEYQSFSGANALLLQGTEDDRGEFSIGIQFDL